MRATVTSQRMKALRKMRAVRCLSTPSRSDREALVHHHAIGLPKPHRCHLLALQREWTGLPYIGLRTIKTTIFC